MDKGILTDVYPHGYDLDDPLVTVNKKILHDMNETIRKQEERIAALEDCLKARDERIENQKETVERLDERIAELEADLKYQTEARTLDAIQYANNVKLMAKRIRDMEGSTPASNEGDLTKEQWQKMKQDIYG